MPKLISAAEPTPTLLAMVMLDRRLSLAAADSQRQRRDESMEAEGMSPLLDALLGEDRQHRRDWLSAVGEEARA